VWILYNDIILAKESKYVKLLNTTSSGENIIMSISNMLSNVKIENIFRWRDVYNLWSLSLL